MPSLLARLVRAPRPNLVHRRLLSQAKDSTSKPIADATRSSSLNTSASHGVGKQPARSRLDRLLERTPRSIRGHVSSLRTAPVTHITAFLILHEITAIVPLFGLAAAFHYYNWLPTYFSEGAWVVAGVEKFGRYFRRKGWISSEEEEEAERLAERDDAEQIEGGKTATGKWFDRGEGGVRLVVEFATAYAIVKALLIPRLFISAWGAPWFARWTVLPLLSTFKRVVGR